MFHVKHLRFYYQYVCYIYEKSASCSGEKKIKKYLKSLLTWS